MIDYLNPSHISANPPEGTEPFCVEICTTNCKKTALRGEKVRKSAEIICDRDYTDTTQDYTDEEADNG
jgi:hypothetical protein